MINPLHAAFSALVSKRVTVPVASETKSDTRLAVENAAKTEKKATDQASFSTLASQLNESAARASKRDAGMTHAELGKYGLSRISEFLSETPKANSYTRAMEVPNTTDPELLDRARAATAFVTQTLAGHEDARSPFDKLSREQLNLIAYDDSGAFTLNERRAAWQGVQKMDDAWRKVAIAEGMIEQTRYGQGIEVLSRGAELLQIAACHRESGGLSKRCRSDSGGADQEQANLANASRIARPHRSALIQPQADAVRHSRGGGRYAERQGRPEQPDRR
ncbi:hypothetical protein [Pseudomonas sp. UBA1879]|uniref:hypothetical protein n=1 Tax=Pseudomonas sp. UBA1879 TaxID=1947305 RepID=UPI0025DDF392|nr:hypothetical protein [Pseudomonas sp. UBA1879]